MSDLIVRDEAADEINREYDLGCSAVFEGVHTGSQHFVNCGRRLEDEKAKLGRGNFDGWVEAHCLFKRAQAYRFIQWFKMPETERNRLLVGDGFHALRQIHPSGRQRALPPVSNDQPIKVLMRQFTKLRKNLPERMVIPVIEEACAQLTKLQDEEAQSLT